jgi:lipopolysaccharide/colanic/teichoic acid biosynthesis glycosyltransferase
VTTVDERRSRSPFARAPLAPHLQLQRVHRDRSLALPLRVLGSVHSGSPGVPALLTDLLVLVAAATAELGTRGLVLALTSFAALVTSGRVYRDRDRVVARGVAWWPGTLVGPLAVGVLADLLITGDAVAQTALAALGALLGLLLVRALAWGVVSSRRRSGRDLAVALVVGDGDRAATLARTLDRHREIGLRVGADVGGEVLADPHRLAAAAVEHRAQHVFLVPNQGVPSPPPLRRALGVPVHVSYVPLVSDALLDSRPRGRVGGVAVLPLGRPLRGPGPMRGKRATDLVLASVLLVVTSPLLLLAAAAVWLDDRGPVLFRQERTGRFGEKFQITKFRPMRPGSDLEQLQLTSYNTSDGLLFKMSHDPRVTRVGRLLRRTGLDELPQLIDVLRGRMSLIGPRPLPVDKDAFSERDGERHLVRPGMTGLWQVSGGSTLRYREMIDLDLAYVHAWTSWLDVQIVLSTLAVLLRATFGCEGHER